MAALPPMLPFPPRNIGCREGLIALGLTDGQINFLLKHGMQKMSVYQYIEAGYTSAEVYDAEEAYFLPDLYGDLGAQERAQMRTDLRQEFLNL